MLDSHNILFSEEAVLMTAQLPIWIRSIYFLPFPKCKNKNVHFVIHYEKHYLYHMAKQNKRKSNNPDGRPKVADKKIMIGVYIHQSEIDKWSNKEALRKFIIQSLKDNSQYQ